MGRGVVCGEGCSVWDVTPLRRMWHVMVAETICG